MNNEERTEYVTRNDILKLISDDEIAKVSNMETVPHFLDTDEYIDLEHLDWGVCRKNGKAIPVASTVSKIAVHENTWKAILALLSKSKPS